jgi:hypothetical protein
MVHRKVAKRPFHRPVEPLESRRLLTAGDLDPSFGAGGFANASFGTDSVYAIDVAAFGNRTFAAGGAQGRIAWPPSTARDGRTRASAATGQSSPTCRAAAAAKCSSSPMESWSCSRASPAAGS